MKQIPFPYKRPSTNKAVNLLVVGNIVRGGVLCEHEEYRNIPVRVPIELIPEHNLRFVDDAVLT